MTRVVRRCNIAALCVERELIYISFQSYCSLVLVDVTCSGSKKSDYIPLSDQLQLWCGFIVWPLQGWLRKWLRLVCFLVLLAFSLHVKILHDNMSLFENRVISGKRCMKSESKYLHYYFLKLVNLSHRCEKDFPNFLWLKRILSAASIVRHRVLWE